jgi:hypothetical protein
MLGLMNGAAGRVRATISELRLRLSTADREQADLERARRLDAEEVGRRADRRQIERVADGSDESDQNAL